MLPLPNSLEIITRRSSQVRIDNSAHSCLFSAPEEKTRGHQPDRDSPGDISLSGTYQGTYQGTSVKTVRDADWVGGRRVEEVSLIIFLVHFLSPE